MTNAEGYNYDHYIKQGNNDMNYENYYKVDYDPFNAENISTKKALNIVLEIAKKELAGMIDRRKGAEDTLNPLGHKLAPPTEINELQESIKILEVK